MVLIPEGFAQVALRFMVTGDPEPMFVTFGVHLESAPSAETVANGAVAEWVASGLMGRQSSSTTITGAIAAVGQDGGPPIIGEASASTAGSQSGDAFPPNVALLIRKRTALGGRRMRGRMYVPGIPESDTDSSNGVIAASRQTAWQTAAANFLAGIAASSWATAMVVLHSTGLTAAPVPTTVSNLVVDAKVATQRRRLR